MSFHQARNIALNSTPFGSSLKTRGFSAGSGFRFGFGSHEKMDTEMGVGIWVNMGDRCLDIRLGRTSKTDSKGEMFPNISPYTYVMNSTLNASDNEGKLVIFINGYYGFPTLACYGGTQNHWENKDKNWVSQVLNRIGDKKARFYDGSLGGAFGVVSGAGDIFIGAGTSLDPETRRLAGYNLGLIEAKDILQNLQRDNTGKITESIKFITSSMGAAYQRGYSQAIKDYVLTQNKEIDAYQGSEINIDKNATSNYYMINDGFEKFFLGDPILGSVQIGVDKNRKTTMHGHHPSYADPKSMPQGKHNPSGSGIIENPSI